jgi:uncharacterized membrane protein
MKSRLVCLGAFAAVFIVLDVIWIFAAVMPIYAKSLPESMLAPQPSVVAALLFYVIFITSACHFVVWPGVEARAPWTSAGIEGAFFGFTCYATYGLTNQAVLRSWPWLVALSDILWGAFVTAVACAASVTVGTR